MAGYAAAEAPTMAELPDFITDGPGSWCAKAWEPFFKKVTPEQIAESSVDSSKVRVSTSKLVPTGFGAFARADIAKGVCVEWGLATIIPKLSTHEQDQFFTWTSHDRTDNAPIATCSGAGIYYNTKGMESNCRCVPFHNDKRFEVYALEDIKEGAELTFRYDSMNWREAFKDVKEIVGDLTEEHHK